MKVIKNSPIPAHEDRFSLPISRQILVGHLQELLIRRLTLISSLDASRNLCSVETISFAGGTRVHACRFCLAISVTLSMISPWTIHTSYAFLLSSALALSWNELRTPSKVFDTLNLVDPIILLNTLRISPTCRQNSAERCWFLPL